MQTTVCTLWTDQLHSVLGSRLAHPPMMTETTAFSQSTRFTSPTNRATRFEPRPHAGGRWPRAGDLDRTVPRLLRRERRSRARLGVGCSRVECESVCESFRRGGGITQSITKNKVHRYRRPSFVRKTRKESTFLQTRENRSEESEERSPRHHIPMLQSRVSSRWVETQRKRACGLARETQA